MFRLSDFVDLQLSSCLCNFELETPSEMGFLYLIFSTLRCFYVPMLSPEFAAWLTLLVTCW